MEAERNKGKPRLLLPLVLDELKRIRCSLPV